jgi:hypothetical protein
MDRAEREGLNSPGLNQVPSDLSPLCCLLVAAMSPKLQSEGCLRFREAKKAARSELLHSRLGVKSGPVRIPTPWRGHDLPSAGYTSCLPAGPLRVKTGRFHILVLLAGGADSAAVSWLKITK